MNENQNLEVNVALRPATHEPKLIPARQLYHALLTPLVDETKRNKARRYLHEQIACAATLDSDLPENWNDLRAWIQHNSARVGNEYRAYRQARRDGAPRRFFSCRSHALYYLGAIAPTKRVDGAWLYGLTSHWNDPRFYGLIRTYLEELGDGAPARNHVAIYERLLAAYGCDISARLTDAHYVQGAIQLVLAYNARSFLPEIIGYNLGYEQPPLHMLMTAHELKELRIDPSYFSLHVTIDNAGSGHAARAARSVINAQPRVGPRDVFHERVANGYRLNALGLSAHVTAGGFDLEAEVIAMLKRKSAIGRYMHSDYHKIDGRSVSQWLADPDQVPAFLQTLQNCGWIKRHEPPTKSRFWHLVEGDHAAMFGVFSAYERQLLYDWIAGDRASSERGSSSRQGIASRALYPQRVSRSRQNEQTDANDFNRDQHLLNAELAKQPTRDAAMAFLAQYMSPSLHHTVAGLWATRRYAELLD